MPTTRAEPLAWERIEKSVRISLTHERHDADVSANAALAGVIVADLRDEHRRYVLTAADPAPAGASGDADAALVAFGAALNVPEWVIRKHIPEHRPLIEAALRAALQRTP